jgi:hypothetical protein
MDLPKFVDLLHSKTLYFQRADGFPDKFEGALTPAIRLAMDKAKKDGKTKQSADDYYRRCRKGNYVSCWSVGERDNMALWQLYGGLKSCVAITSTVEKILNVAVTWNETTLIRRVKYIDHVKNPDMVVGHYDEMLRYKHESYRYEKELRIIIPRQGAGWEGNPSYVRLPLQNLNDLVRSVVVAPEAETWFYDAINDLSIKYELNAPVRRSKLVFMRI